MKQESNERAFEDIWLTVTGRTNAVFSVKACTDAHVALSEIPGLFTTNTYEIIIGGYGNAESKIRLGRDTELKSESTPQILNCNDFRYFWVSWAGGVIEMGSGLYVGQSQVIRYVNPNPFLINGLSLSTLEVTDGVWRIDNVGGKVHFYWMARLSAVGC